jgi:putative transposase
MRDERGRSEVPTGVATWAPKGRTPRLVHRFRWAHVSRIGAITSGGAPHHHLYRGRIRSGEVVAFLAHLLRRIPGRIERF